jgi:hypothetical protein
MPKFNVKDLMVSLAGKQVDPLCLNRSICYNFTCFGISYACHQACSYLHTPICVEASCPPISLFCQNHSFTACNNITVTCAHTVITACGFSVDPTEPWKNPEILGQIVPSLDVQELQELKAALQGLVEKVDKEFMPAKKEQLPRLEENLKETLKDVKEQKDKL